MDGAAKSGAAYGVQMATPIKVSQVEQEMSRQEKA